MADAKLEFLFGYDVFDFVPPRSNIGDDGIGASGRSEDLHLHGAELRGLREVIRSEYADFYSRMAALAQDCGASAAESSSRYVAVREASGIEDRGAHWDGGAEIATAIASVVHFSASAGGAAVLIAFLKNAKDVIVQWMKNNARKSLTITLDENRIQIVGNSDVDRALTAAIAELERARGGSDN